MVAFVYANGPNFTDPREFLRQICSAASTHTITEANVDNNSTAAAFYTEAAKRGVNDDTNWTANTYKTILSISSGIGIVTHLMGPTGLAGTPTTTFEITVDGITTTIAVVATAITQRAILGPMNYNTSLNVQYGFSTFNAGKDTGLVGVTQNNYLPPPQVVRFLGIPSLMFRSSLLIRMKTSENNSTTANNERQSAVQYMSMT